MMSAAACEAEASALVADAKRTPFSQERVTLSKQEHIELVMQARYWKSQHERAVQREQRLHGALRAQHQQAEQREAALRSQLQLAQAKIRDLQQRMYGRKSERRWSVEGTLHTAAASSRRSSADVGSSNNSTRGLRASALAIAIRCCWPPERWRDQASALWRSPTTSSSS